MRRRATEERLDALEAALQAWQQREGAPPARLEDLGLPNEPGHPPLVDGWGKLFAYEATPAGARVTSLGANMRPEGGDDITREIAAPRDAAERPPAPAEPAPSAGPPPFDCATGPPARVELEHADPGASKLQEEIAGHRMVPELIDGKPVGVRIFGVRPGHTVARAGLCNGDRLTAVDGRPPPANGRELGLLFSKRGEVEIALNRRGSDHTFRLVVR